MTVRVVRRKAVSVPKSFMQTFGKRIASLKASLYCAHFRFKQCREDEVKEVLKSQYTRWRQQNGVLLFMYSVVLTKGLEQIKNEVEDASEPMIDSQFGHGR